MGDSYRVSGTRVDHGAQKPSPKNMRTDEDAGSTPGSVNKVSASKQNAATFTKEKVETKTRPTSGTK